MILAIAGNTKMYLAISIPLKNKSFQKKKEYT